MNSNSALLFGVLLLLSPFYSFAQADFVTTGGDATSAGGSVSFSVGQVSYTNFESVDYKISLGVQQPELMIMVGTEESTVGYTITVFPNPSSSDVHVQLQNENELNTNNLYYSLYDADGKLLFHQKIKSLQTKVSLHNLPDAIYLLEIRDEKRSIKTFRIFKTN